MHPFLSPTKSGMEFQEYGIFTCFPGLVLHSPPFCYPPSAPLTVHPFVLSVRYGLFDCQIMVTTSLSLYLSIFINISIHLSILTIHFRPYCFVCLSTPLLSGFCITASINISPNHNHVFFKHCSWRSP